MGPRKPQTAEEGCDLKKSLDFLAEEISAIKMQQKSILDFTEEMKVLRDFLAEEISAVRSQQKGILDFIEEVKVWRVQKQEQDQKIAFLERRVMELEQYTRMNDVVITGLSVKPRSYARAVTTNRDGEPDEQDISSVEQQVLGFLREKGIQLDCDGIEACHTLPRKNVKDKPAIVMRFVNRKQKAALLKQGRKLRGTDVYINEHLTKHNADIAKQARYLKKRGKIQSTWTTNCKVFIKLNGSPEEAKVVLIRDIKDLDKY